MGFWQKYLANVFGALTAAPEQPLPAGQAPQSMLTRVPAVFRYVLHVDSFLALSVLAVVLSTLDWVAHLPQTGFLLALPLGRLIWAVYFFLVSGKAAHGSRRLPTPSDYLDTWDALIRPLLRVFLNTAVIWVALWALLQQGEGLWVFLEHYRAHPLGFLSEQGVAGQLLLAATLLYLPAAVLNTWCRWGLWNALDPSAGFRLAARIPWVYAAAFAIVCGLGLVGVGLDVVGALLERWVPIPLAAPVLGHILCLWVPLAQARLWGEFIYFNRPWLCPNQE